jgi:hypothetical protein
VGGQVRLANEGEGAVRAFEAFLVLVGFLGGAVVTADVSVDAEGVLVWIEPFTFRARDPLGFLLCKKCFSICR